MIKQTCFERPKLNMNMYGIGNDRFKSQEYPRTIKIMLLKTFQGFYYPLFLKNFNVFLGFDGHIHHIMRHEGLSIGTQHL
jgi:hypothetical protein